MRCMASRIDFDSQLVISLIQIVDINNSQSHYFELVISLTNWISDINNQLLIISANRISDTSNTNCWYEQFELVRLKIVDISKSNSN